MIDNEFIKPYLNYPALISALVLATKFNLTKRQILYYKSTNSAWAVQDFQTVGFMVGRQCGATQGILSWMGQHPNECIYITKDHFILKASKEKYKSIHKKDDVDFIGLSFHTSGIIEKWNSKITEEQFKQINYIVVDDALFTLNNHLLKRSDFNKWVADKFNDDTIVILVK